MPPSWPASAPDDSADLLVRLQAGDRGAAALFFERFHGVVRRIVVRETGGGPDVADLLHDVFVQLLERCHQIRDPQALPAWVMTIARRMTRRWMNQRALRRELERQAAERLQPTPAPRPDVAAALERSRLTLETLPSACLTPFILRTFHDLRLEDIARACGVSLATVKRRLQHADGRLASVSRRSWIVRACLGGGAPPA